MRTLLSIVIIVLLSVSVEAKGRRQIKREVIQATNAFRRSNGRGSLTESSKLTKFAQYWANELAKRCHWITSTDHSPWDIKPYRYGGENLHQIGSGTIHYHGEEAVEGWKKSKKGHRETMLKPWMKTIGVGYAKCSTSQYIVAEYST